MSESRTEGGSAQASARAPYRPDIDGLRALAVLAVIGYHAVPAWVPGGFVGVDVFFVVSGFLITGILLDARMPLREFFARRVRRIFPSLVLVLAASIAAGWWILLPHEFVQLGREAAGAAAFGLNFLLWHEAGYFDASADAKPLLHLWSLSVEEQFYLVWPLVLAWSFAARRPAFLFAVACASFALGLVWIVRDAAGAFFLLPTRFWELMAGAFLACRANAMRDVRGPTAHPARGSPQTVQAAAMSIVGLALIVIACAALDPHRRYPGTAALLPVLGTSFLVAAGPHAPVNRLLGLRGMVAIGLVSYPLYLWHWPALSLARIAEGREPSALYKATMLAIAASLAILTYRLVERPVRYGRRAVVAPLLIAMALVGILAVAVALGRLAPRASDPAWARYDVAAHDWDFPGALVAQDVPGGPNLWTAGRGATVLYVGDSNAQQYGPRITGIIAANPALGRRAAFATTGTCPPIVGVASRAGCRSYLERALAYAGGPSVTRVVFAAQWSGYLNDAGLAFDGPGGSVLRGEAALQAALDSFAATVRDLRGAGKAVYVVLNIPAAAELDPRYILQRRFDGSFTLRTQGIGRELWDAVVTPRVGRLGSVARLAGATVIDPTSDLCDATTCPSVDSTGEPRYRDGFHLRAAFVRAHARWVDATLLDPGAD